MPVVVQNKLFKVITPGSGWDPAYYDDKMKAKRHRNQEIERGNFTVVCRGPDHWRGESFNKAEQTPKSRRKQVW